MVLHRFIPSPAGDLSPPLDLAAWRWLRGYFRGRTSSLVVCLVLAAAQPLLALPMIPVVRLAFDRAIPRAEMGLLIALGAALVLLRGFAGAVTVLLRSRLVSLKSHVILDLRRDLLLDLYRRPHEAHARAETQPFVAHMVVDTERLDAMIDSTLGSALPAVLTGIGLAAALAYLDLPLTLAGVALLPLAWLVGRMTARRMGANFRRYHQAYDAFLAGVRFALATFTLTRSRGAEEAEVERQTTGLEHLRSAAVHLSVDNARVAQLQSAVTAMVGAVLLVAGGIAVIRHALTVGGLLAYFAAAALAGAQVERLIACMPVLAEGAAALARLQAYLSAPRAPGYAGRRKIDWSGQVAIEGVDFAYGERPVLESVSLTLPPGRRVGVLGSNGAGKTTLLNLILGLCRPGAGRLSADGVAFDDLDLAAQRRMIGLAPQEPVFFDGSVFDNIAYGAPGLTREAVANLAERIGASRLIDRLPGGLDAPLGEGGLRLSGGERQMIAILRALAPRPRLLLLDEPTNHLDLTATRGVLDALATWPDRPGIVLVSHDPAAMAGLDAVYRIDAARLREVCPTDT